MNMKGGNTCDNIGYIIAPMGLSERQILIYQKLYEKCNFQDMTVKYTMDQLSCDIKIADIPPMTIYKNIQSMIKNGYLEVVKKASKGNAPTYKIIKIAEIMGKPKVNQGKTKGKPKTSNNAGLSGEFESQEKTKGKPKESPIKEKEKGIYINIYSHWNSKKIIVHKSLTDDMTKEIDKALKKYSENEIVQAINIYSEILKSDFYFSHKWSLTDFLNRKNGISTFMDEGSNKNNYIEYLSKQNKENNKSSEPTKLRGWD